MKFILLVAVIAVLTYIPTDGSPLPKKEKPSSVEASDDNDKGADIKDADSDTSEEVTSKPEKKSTSKNGKSKAVKNEEKTVSTAKPVIEEEEENQFYIMVPATGNQVPNFKPFNFKKIPKIPTQPQYVFKQPRLPSMHFPYPMFVPQDRQNKMLVVPETEVEYTYPNTNNRMTDNLPMYYIPSSQTGQTFINEDNLNEINQSPFIYLDKETNPWKTYLEDSGFYM